MSNEAPPEQPGRPLTHGMLTQIKAGITVSYPPNLERPPGHQGYASVLARLDHDEVRRAVIFTPMAGPLPTVIQDHMGPGHSHPFILQCFDFTDEFLHSMLGGKFPSSPLGDGLLWRTGDLWRTSCTPDGVAIKLDADTFGDAILRFAAVHCGAPVTSTGPEIEA